MSLDENVLYQNVETGLGHRSGNIARDSWTIVFEMECFPALNFTPQRGGCTEVYYNLVWGFVICLSCWLPSGIVRSPVTAGFVHIVVPSRKRG